MSLYKYQIYSLSYKFFRIPQAKLFCIEDHNLSLSQICKLSWLKDLKIDPKQIEQHWHHCAQEWAWAQKNNVGVVFWGDENYPLTFKNLKRPPLFLFYRGQFLNNLSNNVAVVGSRNPSELTKAWLDEHLSNFISNTNCCIVSGGARGIDQMAHFAAIRLNRPTVCFLPSGLQKPYPREWARFCEDLIAAGGCLVSPFPIYQDIYKYHFYWRNEMMVAASRLVFITEANLRSGTMMTAKHSFEQGTDIVTLPSHPNLNFAHGNLQLMADGVPFVRDGQELRSLWESLGLGFTQTVNSVSSKDNIDRPNT